MGLTKYMSKMEYMYIKWKMTAMARKPCRPRRAIVKEVPWGKNGSKGATALKGNSAKGEL